MALLQELLKMSLAFVVAFLVSENLLQPWSVPREKREATRLLEDVSMRSHLMFLQLDKQK